MTRAAQMYEGKRFAAGGFRQHELYFPDGSCPSEAILQRFLAIVEAEPGEGGAPAQRAAAVHWHRRQAYGGTHSP